MATATNSSTFNLTLPSDRTIQISRVFSAPRELVFDVTTQPEHVAKWWGCRDSIVVKCEGEPRVGSRYNYVLELTDGSSFAVFGEFREVKRPEKVVQTQTFGRLPQYEAMVTLLYEELEGKTKLTNFIEHASKEARDAMLALGVDAGFEHAYEKLENVVRVLG